MGLPSGKFVLRLPPLLHRQLREEAEIHSASLNAWIISRLSGGQPSLNPAINQIKEAFGDSLIGVVLFGSNVRGEQRENSDVDLLIVMHEDAALDRALYKKWDEKLDIGHEYSPQFSHFPKGEKASSLWLEVAMEGEILLDTDYQIKVKLRDIRESIAAGKYVRKISHGHPYWIHVENK